MAHAVGVKPINIWNKPYATTFGELLSPKLKNATKKPEQAMTIRTKTAMRSDAMIRNAISS
jgi:hypothetical protein